MVVSMLMDLDLCGFPICISSDMWSHVISAVLVCAHLICKCTMCYNVHYICFEYLIGFCNDEVCGLCFMHSCQSRSLKLSFFFFIFKNMEALLKISRLHHHDTREGKKYSAVLLFAFLVLISADGNQICCPWHINQTTFFFHFCGFNLYLDRLLSLWQVCSCWLILITISFPISGVIMFFFPAVMSFAKLS